MLSRIRNLFVYDMRRAGKRFFPMDSHAAVSGITMKKKEFTVTVRKMVENESFL